MRVALHLAAFVPLRVALVRLRTALAHLWDALRKGMLAACLRLAGACRGMVVFKSLIVFNQLLQRHRHKTVDIDARVQHPGIIPDQRPEARGCCIVDMAEDHVAVAPRPGHAGHLLLQKYYTVDFLTKKVAPNQGQVPQYLVENNHDPIVPVEIYNQVQVERERRRRNYYSFKYLHNSSLSGRAKCAECGTSLRRVKSKDGENTYTYWRCGTKVKGRKYPGADCAFKGIKEETLKCAVYEAFNWLPDRRDELIRLEQQVRWLGLKPADEMLAQIEQGDHTIDEDSVRTQRAIYADKLVHIRNLLDRIDDMVGPRKIDSSVRVKCSLKDYMEKGENPACPDVEEFYRRTRRRYPRGRVTQFSDDDVIRFVERILVGNDRIIVEFKAGVAVEVLR